MMLLDDGRWTMQPILIELYCLYSMPEFTGGATDASDTAHDTPDGAVATAPQLPNAAPLLKRGRRTRTR